jgi:phosphoglycolate phosphatase
MIRNIIFDWSGTLVDDLPAVWRASNFVFRQAGVTELSLEEFRAEFCLPFTRFYDRYTPHIAMSQLEAWFHGHFRECQEAVLELPHAREFLQFCRRAGLRTFLLSSVHEEHFARQIAVNGFHEFLDHPYVGVWDKRTKIRELIEVHALRPAETLFVGDMEHDIETARHGGVVSCAVLTGYNRLAQLRASEPDLIVEHLGELRRLLESSGFEVKPPWLTMPVATVGALIFRGGTDEVLMVRTHKWSDLWGIPGGKIKLGEGSEDALRREIMEETSLQIDQISFVLVQDCIHSPEFYRDAHFVLLNYTCRATGAPQVRLNEEAREYLWTDLNRALALPLNQPTRRLVETVLRQRTSIHGSDHHH